MKALEWLRHSNEQYKDTQLNGLWEEANRITNAELWESLNVEAPISDNSNTEETGDTCSQPPRTELTSTINDEDNLDSDEEDDHPVPGVQFDICLQRSEGPGLEYSIAPGEEQHPISMFQDQQHE